MFIISDRMAGTAETRKIGPYTVILKRKNILGTGSFGTVFRCKHEDGKDAAAKKIDLFKVKMQENVESLKASELIPYEKHLKHKNIVEFLYVELIGDIELWIIMNLCDTNLEDYAKKENPDATSCQALVIQCAEALDYLHSEKIVHRDLKPNNVLLNKMTPFPLVKLTDFSLSKDMAGLVDDYTETVRGSIYWMAPELLTMTGGPDKTAFFTRAIDIFSLALIYLFTCIKAEGHGKFSQSCK